MIVKLSDFGLAKKVNLNEAGLYECETVAGTPNYMAPELRELKSGPLLLINKTVDIWGYGCVLYELFEEAGHTFHYDKLDTIKRTTAFKIELLSYIFPK